MILEVAAAPDVTVIIVNWNAGRLLGECLDSVKEAERGFDRRLEIVVVDNGSVDGSAQDAARRNAVTVVQNSRNRGFAAACNQGAQIAKGSRLLFLNPDCRMAAGSVEASLRALDEDPSIGVVGVALLDDEGQIHRSCYRIPTLRNFLYRISGLSSVSSRLSDGSMRDWPHDSNRRVDHVIGAFYMVRASEFRELGGFDERYFVYLEDLDLSLRYRQRGQQCLFLASPASYHKGGGVSDQVRSARLFYATRSRILFAFKHFTAMQAWLHLAATLGVEPLARLVQLAAQGRWREIPEIWRAFAMLYGDLPAMLRLAF